MTADPNAGNNTAASSIAVGTSADLSVTNSDSPDPVQALANITYTQVVTNPGPSNAANVTFTEVIPANTNFRSFVPPAGLQRPGRGRRGNSDLYDCHPPAGCDDVLSGRASQCGDGRRDDNHRYLYGQLRHRHQQREQHRDHDHDRCHRRTGRSGHDQHAIGQQRSSGCKRDVCPDRHQ